MPFRLGRKEPPPPDAALLDAFAAALSPDPGADGPATRWSPQDTKALVGRDVPLFTLFMAERSRSSFGGGLLRFLLPQTRPSITDWNSRDGWHSDWPSVPGGFVFASDWLGRLYLLVDEKRHGDEPHVALFDPVTVEFESFGSTFGEFLGNMMPRLWRVLLEVELFEAWRGAGGDIPAPGDCVCHKIPLALGGADNVSNMETMSLMVWVSICGQIHEQTKDLPPGTPISGFTIDESKRR